MSTYNRLTTRCLHTTRPARARIHDKQNHYDVLQVGRTSSKRDIKNRFYELSKKAHPDVPGGNRATFEKLSEAYSVLGDDSKRRQYDISLQPRSSSGVTHSTPYYSPHSPYLRNQRPGNSTGPHRAWAGTAKSATGQGSTYSRPQNPGSWTDYGFAERTGGAAGRRASGPPPQFGSASHHPNLHRYPFGGGGRSSGGSTQGGAGGGGGGGGGGLGDDGGEEIRKDSGVLRFFGVLAMLMTVIGLGGGFNARADEKTHEEEDSPDGYEVWSSEGESESESDVRTEVETRGLAP